jgi:hypothetical protein
VKLARLVTFGMQRQSFQQRTEEKQQNAKQSPFQIQHTRVLLQVFSRGISEKECTIFGLRYFPANKTRPVETRLFQSSGRNLVFFSMTASAVLTTDPEVGVRFPALPDFQRSSGSGTGSTQPREYK